MGGHGPPPVGPRRPTNDRIITRDEDMTFTEFLQAAERPSLEERQSSSTERKRRRAGTSPERRRNPSHQQSSSSYEGPVFQGRSYQPIQTSSNHVASMRPTEPGSRPTNAIDLTDSPAQAPRPPVPQRRSNNNERARSRSNLETLPRWQPDHEVNACPVCNNPFSFFFRKHHCRKCGRVVCSNCSPHRITIPKQYVVQPPANHQSEAFDAQPIRNLEGGEVVRVCNPCVPDPWAPGQTEDQNEDELGRGLRHLGWFGTNRGAGMPSANDRLGEHPPADENEDEIDRGLRHLGWYGRTDNNLDYRPHQNAGGRAAPAMPSPMRGPVMGEGADNYVRPRDQRLSPQELQQRFAQWQNLRILEADQQRMRAHARYRAQSHQSGTNLSRSLPQGRANLLQGRADTPQGRLDAFNEAADAIYADVQRVHATPPPRANRYFTSAGRRAGQGHARTMSDFTPPGLPSRATATAARDVREVREEDECPVCGEELAPGEETRSAHIQDCITSRFATSSTPTQTAPFPTPGGSLPTGSLPRNNSLPGATRPRAGTYRMRGMAVYRATEKDCVNEDGEAQECVICFEEFEAGDEMGRMECLCKFHRGCIRQWWDTKGAGSCPTHQLHE